MYAAGVPKLPKEPQPHAEKDGYQDSEEMPYRNNHRDARLVTRVLVTVPGMIPFGLTHFFFESCHVFAQRVNNALVRLFSHAAALELPRVEGIAEDDPDFLEARQDSADWQDLVRSRD